MVRIPLCHRARLMPEKPLYLVQINPPLDEARGERVPHIVEPKIWNPGPIASLAELSHQVPNLKFILERRLEHRPA